MSFNEITETLADAGIHQVSRKIDLSAAILFRRVECQCGAHEEVRLKAGASVEAVIRGFVKKGWSVGHRNGFAYCPDCARKRSNPGRTGPRFNPSNEMLQAFEELRRQGFGAKRIAADLGIGYSLACSLMRRNPGAPANGHAVLAEQAFKPVSPPPPAAPPEPALDVGQIATVLEFLNKYFHDGRYSHGWSDAKIADILEISTGRVSLIRIGSPLHGKIRPSPEALNLRGEMEALKSTFMAEIANIENLARDLDAKIADLERAE